MKRKRHLLAMAALVSAIWPGMIACDSAGASWGDADSFAEVVVDLALDTAPDPVVDLPPDTTPDLPGDDGSSSCTYPAGPYAFAVGSTVGPMAWPSAVKGAEDLSSAADFAAIRCEPGVKSIFVMVASTT